MPKQIHAHVTPHNGYDIGWRKAPGDWANHYWLAGKKTILALSHCGEIETKTRLIEDDEAKHCKYCEMIEQLRDYLDAS